MVRFRPLSQPWSCFDSWLSCGVALIESSCVDPLAIARSIILLLSTMFNIARRAMHSFMAVGIQPRPSLLQSYN